MRNYLIFDGKDCRDYGVYISGSGTYNAPGREYEQIPVPGRDGDLIGLNPRLSNIELTYPAFIYTNFRANLAAFRSMLLSRIGYKRLEDTYHPEEFRRAFYRGGAEVEARSLNDAGQFDLTFTCDPRRFLKAGEASREFTSAGTINNPTDFDSKPLIRVYGNGTLSIGSDVIDVAAGFPYIDIDSEAEDCYHGTDNANALVRMRSGDFPHLKPGPTGIGFSGSITAVRIVPKWWRV